MKRYFVHFAYDGAAYHGWQIQPNGNSVQAEMERAFSLALRKSVSLVGAGRTDAGVHARHIVAHFDTEQSVDVEQLVYRVNRILPRDIAVDRIEEVAADKHARFSARARTYYYYIHTKRDPFCRAYSCELHYALDFQKMNEAAAMLLCYDDFGAFCKSHTDVKTKFCHVTHAEWVALGDGKWRFVITANRFLRNMVRAIVGTLIEVGRGRMTIDDFRTVVEGKQRTAAGESMPGYALFLEDVTYD